MLQKRKPMRLICRIDVSAFAAVMVALVGFCWSPQQFYSPHPRSAVVDRPIASQAIEQPKALREDAMIVAVQRDGSIFFGSEKVLPEQLPARTRDQLTRGAEPKIYINADRRARHGAVLRALDAIRESGVEGVAFLMERPRISGHRN